MAYPKTPKNELEAVIAALDAHQGNQSKAAQALGISRTTLIGRMQAAALEGLRPQPRQSTIGTSTLYDADGNVKLQWVKAATGQRTPEEWAVEVRSVFADCEPVARIAPPAAKLNKDLLTVYPIGDHHVAMYSWAEETGADYDIKLADQLLTSAAHHLVDLAPASQTAMIVNLGDFFHVDNLENRTSRSGHALDVDTRYAAMIRTGVRMLRTVIECALTKHRNVIVVNAIGNHDDIGALWLSLTLAQFYESNPRVTISQSPSKFYYHRHGKVLIGVTHGDTGKPERLAPVMAADRPEDWGQTAFRYWLTGHVHNRKVLEFPGVMWETFRTLAPSDAWAKAAGYRSGRDMTSIVFHAAHGELARHRFDVSMLR